MTYIDPGQPPEIMPPSPQEPEIQPGETPDEMPPLEPGGDDDGDSRPYGQQS